MKYKVTDLFTIYGLYCAVKNAIIYVGCTNNIASRMKTHFSSTERGKLYDYLAELRKDNRLRDLRYVILQENVPLLERCNVEKYWIQHLAQSHELLNVKHMPIKTLADTPALTIAEYEKISGKKISKLKAA